VLFSLIVQCFPIPSFFAAPCPNKAQQTATKCARLPLSTSPLSKGFYARVFVHFIFEAKASSIENENFGF